MTATTFIGLVIIGLMTGYLGGDIWVACGAGFIYGSIMTAWERV